MWLCWCRQRFYKKFRRCHWSDMGVGRVVGPCGICPISEAGFHARRSQITHNYRCRHSPARNSKGAPPIGPTFVTNATNIITTLPRNLLPHNKTNPAAKSTKYWALITDCLSSASLLPPPAAATTQCCIIQVAPPKPLCLNPASLSNVTVPLPFSLCGALLAT